MCCFAVCYIFSSVCVLAISSETSSQRNVAALDVRIFPSKVRTSQVLHSAHNPRPGVSVSRVYYVAISLDFVLKVKLY